jgi:hypothetical protein
MAGMRERLGGRLRPPSRLDGRRIRRRSGEDEADIDDPVMALKRGRYQLDMVNRLLSRASLVHPPIRHCLMAKCSKPSASLALRALCQRSSARRTSPASEGVPENQESESTGSCTRY